MLLVGICGAADHGKDTFAKLAKECFPNWESVAFADKLREMALAIDPIVEVDTSIITELQDSLNPLPFIYIRLSELVNRVGWNRAKKTPDVRRFLQRIGTEGGRNIFGEDVWVDLAMTRAKELQSEGFNVMFTDTRFPNEFKIVRDHGGVLVRVRRFNKDGTPYVNQIGTSHESEKYFDTVEVDRVFDNVEGQLDRFKDEIKQYLGSLLNYRSITETIYPESNNLLTVKEAADYLKVQRRFLDSRRYAGGGPPFMKLSYKTVRYKKSDLDLWMHSMGG